MKIIALLLINILRGNEYVKKGKNIAVKVEGGETEDLNAKNYNKIQKAG